MLTRGGLYIKCNKELKKDLKKEFTFSRMEGFNNSRKMIHYKYYKETDDGIFLPPRNERTYKIFKKLKEVKNCIVSSKIKPKCTAIFTENQQVVINHVSNLFKKYLEEDNNIPIRTGTTIIMDTGLGKTFLAMGFITEFKKKTIYITYDKKSLLEAKRTIEKYMNVKVSTYYSEKKDLTGDVVIIVVNSLMNIEMKNLKDFGLIIYDEIPDYVTKKRLELFFKTNMIYNIGLTATPYKEGLEIIYINHVGDLLFANKISGFNQEEIIFTGEVRKINYNVKKTIRRTDGTLDFMSTIGTYNDLPDRTDIVLKCLNECLKEGKSVYIFSTIKKYLYHLFSFIKEEKSIVLTGGEKTKTILENLEKARDCKIILTTYGFAEKCLSISHMDSIIYATPRKNAQQSSGRIVRRDGNIMSSRIIYDIVDDCFSRQFYVRKKTYDDRNFKIIKNYNI